MRLREQRLPVPQLSPRDASFFVPPETETKAIICINLKVLCFVIFALEGKLIS